MCKFCWRTVWIKGVVLLAAGLPGRATAGEADRVVFDFETGDLQGWRIVEGKFVKFLSDRPTSHHHNRPFNKQGKYFLTTLDDVKPDGRFTGVAESPVFVLARPKMSLLVAGGRHANTYVALCTLDGMEVIKAHGENAQPFKRVAWNAPQLVGKKVFLRIADGHPGGWGYIALDDFAAEGRLDPDATRQHFAKRKPILDAIKGGEPKGPKRPPGPVPSPSSGSPAALRAAVRDLMSTFGPQYSGGAGFGTKLDRIEKRLRTTNATERKKAQADLAALRREALTANPLLSSQPILFVVRRQYAPDHHNTATLFMNGEYNEYDYRQRARAGAAFEPAKAALSFRPGGAIKIIDFARGGKVTTLLDVPEGIARDPEVHFDGERILFSMRKTQADSYHIYEINVDGTGLRQLTFAEGVADIDPLYLPDGGIIMSSTREPKYCGCNRHIMCNLFRMSAEGENIHQISKNPHFDGHGFLMPDGRILYDRWEYVDRLQLDAQGLWTCNPDGTNHAIYWGNNTNSPGAVLDARAIPGTGRVVCVFAACHDRPWGALAVVDPGIGIDGRKPVIRTWPAAAVDLVSAKGNHSISPLTRRSPRKGRKIDWDTFRHHVKLKYEDPYPLSDKYFLCSRMTGRGEQMGLCLVDVFGNELLLHTEEPGCYDPMPVAPRRRPPMTASRRDFKNADGQFYVLDVYRGTHMKGVQRGAVKSLRVVETTAKRFWTPLGWYGGAAAPALNWHNFENKRILGTVPVEADGSAYFTVPSEKFVFFQLLDENGMMIHSMRSGTLVQPGELAGCVGCHEDRHTTAPAGRIPLAMKRPPGKLSGWYGTPRLFNYMNDVQPVFNKHCVRCHDYGKKASKKLKLAGDRTLTFNTSYNELWRKGYTGCIGAGAAPVQQAYAWGSHISKLVATLRKGHNDVKLSAEETARIVTWIDLNGPFYPDHGSAYPQSLSARTPLDRNQIRRLEKLTGYPLRKQNSFNSNRGPLVSFDRPELSPCLAALKRGSAKYAEALAIIRAGKAILQEKPRADMAEFRLSDWHQKVQEKYDTRRQIELDARRAILTGRKVHDSPANP